MKSERSERREWAVLVLAIGAALATSISLAACNTTEGAGKDMEEAGEAIQDGAD